MPVTDEERARVVAEIQARSRVRRRTADRDLTRGHKGYVTCSTCMGVGHNARSCPRNAAHAPVPQSTTRSRSEAAARDVRENGGTLREAGKRFGITTQAVQQAWARIYPGEMTPTEIDLAWVRFQIIALAMEGCDAPEISTATGASDGHVRNTCEQSGVALADADRGHLLVDDAVAAVKAGATVVDVAIAFGVSHGHLQRVLKSRGVHARTGGHGKRMDGRLRRAADLVAAGMSIPEAARREGCAPAGLYQNNRARVKEAIARRNAQP